MTRSRYVYNFADYYVASHYAGAIAYCDYTTLDDTQERQLEEFLNSVVQDIEDSCEDAFFGISWVIDTEYKDFNRCEVTGVVDECIKLSVLVSQRGGNMPDADNVKVFAC